MRVIGAVIISVLLIVGALVFTGNSDGSQSSVINASQLSEADGKDGRSCWLAVDGIVYEIEQGYKWAGGEHTESSMAYCGADMSNVIDSAPHGRTKLSQLKKVGTLAQ